MEIAAASYDSYTRLIYQINRIRGFIVHHVCEIKERLKYIEKDKYLNYDMDALELWLKESPDNYVFKNKIKMHIDAHMSILKFIVEAELKINMVTLKSVIDLISSCQKKTISINNCIKMIQKMTMKKNYKASEITNTFIGGQFLEFMEDEDKKKLILQNIVNKIIDKIVDLKYRPYEDEEIKRITPDDTDDVIMHKRYLYRMQLIGIMVVKYDDDISPYDIHFIIKQMNDIIEQSKTMNPNDLHALWTRKRRSVDVNSIDIEDFKIDKSDIDPSVSYIWIMTREFILHKLVSFFADKYTDILDSSGHFQCCECTDNLRNYPEIQNAIYDELVWNI
jgi:hypothetical protein